MQLTGVRPLFWVYKGFVVIVWWGCTIITESRVIIYDLYVQFRWYVVKSLLLKGFLKVGEEVKFLISMLFEGVVW